MKAVRIMYMDKPLREVYPHATTWQVFKYKTMRAIRWTIRMFSIALVSFAVLSAVYVYGMLSNRTTVSAMNVIVAAPQEVVKEMAPVMDRIAAAESHRSHYCTEALIKSGMCQKYELGQVLHHVNRDGTIDTGYYQINSVHGAAATKLGFNLEIEEDNKAFAEYLYANEGTEPWYSSKKNW